MARARVSTPLADPVRLSMLRATGMLGTPPEEGFDRLAGLARKVLKTPVAHGRAARRPPPPRQGLHRPARARQGAAGPRHRVLLPARRGHRRVARGRRRAPARADPRPRDRQRRAGARLRGRPADAPRRLRDRHALGRGLQAARLEAGRDRHPPPPRRLRPHRDREPRRHRGPQAGRGRAAALDRPPARADGQQPDGDLRQGPRGPLPPAQPRRRAAARSAGGGRSAGATPTCTRPSSRPRCASTTRP